MPSVRDLYEILGLKLCFSAQSRYSGDSLAHAVSLDEWVRNGQVDLK